MSSVQHPNIIHIYEVFENKEKMVLVMEIAAGGELYDFLSERKCLEENTPLKSKQPSGLRKLQGLKLKCNFLIQ